MQVKGLPLVKVGMTSEEVLSLLGPARKTTATTMKDGIYGVPNRLERKIGYGNSFELWEYEATCPSNSQRAKIWLVPGATDAPEKIQVLDVTVVRHRWSLWFRFCHSPIGERLQDALGIGE